MHANTNLCFSSETCLSTPVASTLASSQSQHIDLLGPRTQRSTAGRESLGCRSCGPKKRDDANPSSLQVVRAPGCSTLSPDRMGSVELAGSSDLASRGGVPVLELYSGLVALLVATSLFPSALGKLSPKNIYLKRKLCRSSENKP